MYEDTYLAHTVVGAGKSESFRAGVKAGSSSSDWWCRNEAELLLPWGKPQGSLCSEHLQLIGRGPPTPWKLISLTWSQLLWISVTFSKYLIATPRPVLDETTGDYGQDKWTHRKTSPFLPGGRTWARSWGGSCMPLMDGVPLLQCMDELVGSSSYHELVGRGTNEGGEILAFSHLKNIPFSAL